MKVRHLPALAAISIVSALSSTAAQTTLHVAPTGNDAAAGKRETPFATLGRARDEIRKLKSSGTDGPFTIELAAGVYPLESTILFGPEDSGSTGKPVTIRSTEKGGAVFQGAVTIPLSKFRPVTDPALRNRLDATARDHVLALPLADSGCLHGGPFPLNFRDRGGIFEIFDAQGRLPLSRWPNSGYTAMGKVLVIGDKTTPGVFEFRGDRPLRWLENPSIWLKGQWRVGWEDPAMKVATIDPAARTIAFVTGLPNGIGSKYHRPTDGSPAGSGEEPWCAINLPEEIDIPGEWAIDFASGTLLVWPRPGTTQLMISQLDQPMIEVKDASHMLFEGLTLSHSLGDGIVMENVDDCVVAGCTIENIAGRGIVLNGVRSGVLSCDIHDIGAGAVYVSGGDRKSLKHSENYVINNHLHHYGILARQYSAAVQVGVDGNPAGTNAVRDAVGVRVAHNVLHHAPRDAFLYSGNDHVFEFNEVYYCAFDTRDTGAWYSWLDWTMRGNVIRYNYVHDTVGGVNPDDGASGNTAYGNVFVGPNVGVWIASGPDNVIRHNIFIKEKGEVFGIDDRGVGRGYANNPRLINRVKELHPTEEPWKSAYPEVATMLENRPELPWRTEFVGNLIVSETEQPVLNKMSKVGKGIDGLLTERDNLVVRDDPGFVNAVARDYRLKPDAPVLSEIPGFEPIPFDRVGLYLDAYRTVLPTESEFQRGPEYSPYATSDGHFGT